MYDKTEKEERWIARFVWAIMILVIVFWSSMVVLIVVGLIVAIQMLGALL